MIPLDRASGWLPPNAKAAAANQTNQTSTPKVTSHPKSTEQVYPRSFAEWDRLMRERPYGRGWAT